MPRRLLALLAVLALSACAQQLAPPPQFGGQLPAIGTLDSRGASTVSSLTLNGKQTFARSLGAGDTGTAVSLPVHTGGSEWVIYQFTPVAGATLLSASIGFHPGGADEAWVAIADFTANHWQFDPNPLPLSVTAGAANLSPNGNVYLAVVTAGFHYAQIDTVSLSVDGNTPPIALFTANPQTGAPGDPVTLDATGSSDPDGTIADYAWDLDGNGTYELDNLLVPTAPTTLPSPAGSVNVGLRVTDNQGAQGTFSLTLTSSSGGGTWHIASPNPDSAGDVGMSTSLAVVNGNPAISYFDFTNQELKYVRATNANGSAWGAPLTLDITGGDENVPCITSLAVMDGNPAISYWDVTNGNLKYIRATDADGSAWGTPLTLDSVGTAVGPWISLAVVAGNPAVSYCHGNSTNLSYVRASDADGSAWGAPQNLGSAVSCTSLVVVNGFPAISYADSNSGGVLKYLRATDAVGSAWGAPQTLDTGDVGFTSQLAVVDGNPAVSYYDTANQDLKYVRATDVDGSTWGAPLTLDSPGDVGIYASLAVVNGNPAISYYDYLPNGDLKYIQAIDADGSAWGAPQVLDSVGRVGEFSSLVVVSGNPAISYWDITNHDLKFISMY